VRSDEHLLALMVQAKCFGRLGYFPRLEDVPDVVVGHIRRDLGLGEDVRAVYDADRTRGAPDADPPTKRGRRACSTG
jgi:hypothetical protein